MIRREARALVDHLVVRRLRSWLGAPVLPVWYHPSYRLPVAAAEGRLGVEPRRADHVVWALAGAGVLRGGDLRTPDRIGYPELGRVHTAAYLESLHDPATLARIFAADPAEIVVDEVMEMSRLACGGTLAAARVGLATGGAAFNLLGGFHHAGPSRGGGMCGVNDIAVAIAAVRAGGFSGQVCIIDLDAHPPDGLAECLGDDPSVWIGSLSGADWGPLPGVIDETVLHVGCDDRAYLAALAALLGRMPRPALAFVIAGGDVLAGDRLGKLGLTLDGARARDVTVAAALRKTPSVWLPGGGYHDDAWRVLAGTGLVLAGRASARVPSMDPLQARFTEIAAHLSYGKLHAAPETPIRLDDIIADLEGHPTESRLCNFYSATGLEYGLHHYGLLQHIERLGYHRLRIVVDSASVGDRARLFGTAGGKEHLLIELVVEPRMIGERQVLFVHWLTLRHPRAIGVELMPGQEVPGLGVAREMCELLARMAARLRLAGVAFRPSHYHLAYVGRSRYRFLDPERQGRFEALVRDLSHLPLPQATAAVAGGRVLLDGVPYTWEADEMVDLLSAPPDDAGRIAAARERSHFTLVTA